MNRHKRSTRHGRWRTAVVVPVAALTWVALGMTAEFANAAAPVSHSSAGQSAVTGNGDGNGGTGNNKGNGNAKHEDPAATPPADTTSGSGSAGTSGDPSQPQPPSNADQNPGGANNGGDCGSYCSTRDGSPSGNGNGNGKATGKPCAGCVGKADNKNPPGQYKDGSDHNNGYECDGNHGVGRSNPAHTGCTNTPPPTCEQQGNCPPPPTCEEQGNCPPPPTCEEQGNCPPNPTCKEEGNCPPNPKCVPTKANNFCSTVLGNHKTKKPPTVLGEKVVRTPNVLPFTGAANLGWLIGSGTVALGLGSGLVLIAGRRSRRRQPA
jgi:hypothetical protein